MSALGQLTALSLIRAAMVSRRVIVPLNVVGAIINNQQRDLDMCNHLFDRGFAGLDVAVAEKCFGRGDDHFGFPEWQKFNLVPLPLATKLRHSAANFSYRSAPSRDPL